MIERTALPGLLILKRPVHTDDRGFFHEIFQLKELEAATGTPFRIVQANHSRSLPRVIRAMHAENWNKIVYPVCGKIFSAVADIRPDSPTFGKVATFTFVGDGSTALYVPKGFANSVCCIGNSPADYVYFVDAYYDGTDQHALGMIPI